MYLPFERKKRISHFYTRQIAHTTTTDKTAQKQPTLLDHTKKVYNCDKSFASAFR